MDFWEGGAESGGVLRRGIKGWGGWCLDTEGGNRTSETEILDIELVVEVADGDKKVGSRHVELSMCREKRRRRWRL